VVCCGCELWVIGGVLWVCSVGYWWFAVCVHCGLLVVCCGCALWVIGGVLWV